MRVERITTNLQVSALATARGFYEDFLGLSTEEFNLGWVARYRQPETGAHVQLVTEDPGGAPFPTASLHVDDVDAAHAEAVAAGHEIVLPLRTEVWGVRRFFVRAPDGHVFNIVQHRG